MKQAYGAVKSAKRSRRRRGVGNANRNATSHVKKLTGVSMAHRREVFGASRMSAISPLLFVVVVFHKSAPAVIFYRGAL